MGSSRCESLYFTALKRLFSEQAGLILARKAEDKALLLHSKSLSNTNYISEKCGSHSENDDKKEREVSRVTEYGYRLSRCIVVNVVI